MPRRGWQCTEMRIADLVAGGRRWLHWLNGDAAYEAYIAHLRTTHPDAAMPTRAEFYRAETERRWTAVRRCC
jgi:uncharacterized short protein YbdD (DUF466 family)